MSSTLISRLVESTRYEDDEAFRRLMGSFVSRRTVAIGVLCLCALACYLIIQILIQGKVPVWSYYEISGPKRIGLVDKLAIATVSLLLVATKLLRAPRSPTVGRALVATASIIVVAAMTLDDVASGNVSHSQGYAALVVLALVGVVPLPPIQALLIAGAVIVSWCLCIVWCPPILGLEAGSVGFGQVVYLAVVWVLAGGIAATLYSARHEEYEARKTAEDLSGTLAERNRALEDAIHNLTAAQDRLIYAEKMASLGRFATGVAHEMRNPLNFVINFAKLSIETLDEMETESGLPASDSQDVRGNLTRIQGHALRAEQIVKALTAHSERRSTLASTIDVNRLIKDQASVLSNRYDAERTGCSVRVRLQLDDALGEIEGLPTDLTYAIDNIIDNAFRATIDRASSGEEEYEPEIVISTSRNDSGVAIEIRDNGVGIADAKSGKIFEPFYTTRPTGSGTGLGLTSAYAAITEGHGGSISVESQPGVGSVFTILLRPVATPISESDEGPQDLR